MIAIITSIFVVISVLISSLVSFAPNANKIIDNDFRRALYNNALSYGREIGQLKIRTGKLTVGSTAIIISLGNFTKNVTSYPSATTCKKINVRYKHTSATALVVDIYQVFSRNTPADCE